MRKISTRKQTRLTGRFIRDARGSSSLLRGLSILRAFRLEQPFLSNAQISELTGIPRSTVSRLTTSLVQAGFLSYVVSERVYRLEPVALSLAMVYQSHSYKLRMARPLMDNVARREQLNVGLAVRDQLEMVYLDSLRFSRSNRESRVSPGTRIPIESTALGRAFLYGMPLGERQELVRALAKNCKTPWTRVRRELDDALQHMERYGWCAAPFKSTLISIATPLTAQDGSLLAINISFPWERGSLSKIPQRYSDLLIDLAERVTTTWRESR